MKTNTALQTIEVSYKEICEGQDPWIPLGNFMDDSFGNFTDRRVELVQDPLHEPANATPDMHKWAAFCAGSVEYLCQKYAIPCPAWVHNPTYILPEPWFHSSVAAQKPHVRERIIQETPEPFTRRNIYCGNRVYMNKYEAAANIRLRLSVAS